MGRGHWGRRKEWPYRALHRMPGIGSGAGPRGSRAVARAVTNVRDELEAVAWLRQRGLRVGGKSRNICGHPNLSSLPERPVH